MKRDPRFGSSSGPEGHRHRLSGKTFVTLEACHEDFLKEVAGREELAGRPLTREELINGITRTDGRSDREKREAEKRRSAELNPAPADNRTPAERYRDELRAEDEAARLAALSPRERRLLRAEQAVAAENAQAVQADAKASALSTDAGRRLTKELAATILHAEFDPSVPLETLDELRHQRNLLDRFGDVAAVGRNVSVIRDAISKGITAQADALKASADRISAKVARLRGDVEPSKPTGDVRTLLS